MDDFKIDVTQRNFKLNRPLKMRSLAAALLMTFVIQAGVVSDGAAQTIDDGVVSIENTTAAFSTNAEDNLFSTREQRLQVEPANWNEDQPDEAEFSYQSQEELELFDEPAGRANGGGPGDEANNAFGDSVAFSADGFRELSTSGADELGVESSDFGGARSVFSRYRGNHFRQMWRFAPWNKIGKLYFTTSSGESGFCTANVISPRSVIVTAAHCVYTFEDGFHSNFVFVPAERYGNAPYGTFEWASAHVGIAWINVGGRRNDVAVLRLRPRSDGRTVANLVGWLGFAWNQRYTQHLHSVGYAANLSARIQNICASQSFFSSLEGSNVVVKGCDMTFGSSGGGWLNAYTPYSNGGNFVTSVVSGPHVGGSGNTFVGPRFTVGNIVPLCNTAGC